VIAELIVAARQQWLDGAESINLPGSDNLFPIWSPELFGEYQLLVLPTIEEWKKCIEWLKRGSLKGHSREVKDTLRALSSLKWAGNIPYFCPSPSSLRNTGNPVNSLAKFLSRDWFSNRQIDQMTDLIVSDIQAELPARDVRMMDTLITTEILKQYGQSKSEDSYDPAAEKFLQRFGRGIQDGTELLGIFHIHENHWVPTTADVFEQSIGFADPHRGIDLADVCAALRWFAQKHGITLDEDVDDLLCTAQEDSWNCGLYASSALAHKYLPHQYPLVGSHHVLGDIGRMEMLCRIIHKFHERDIPLSKRYSTSPITPPPCDNLAYTMGRLSVSPSKRAAKRRKVGNNSDSDDNESPSSPRPPIAPLFTRVASRTVSSKKTVSGKKSVKKVEDKQEAQAMLAIPSDASDGEDVSSSSMPGRRRSEIMDLLTVEVKVPPPTRKYRCAGLGCSKTYHPRTSARVLRHAKRCLKLSSEQRQCTSKSSADTSLGARAEELAKGLSTAELNPPTQTPNEFFGSAGSKQVRERNAALLDLAVVKLFCAAGLPPRLADYPEYKEVFRLAALAGPRYVPAGRTILIDNHIMSEQERVRALQIAFLKTQTRLSVSCDGGDLRSGEYFYTIHASTPEGRSFLLEGVECTDVSHTAQWIADTVMEAMRPIGIEHFGSASADSTGNTRGFRRILCERVVTILDLADSNHHLSNTCKDIVLLPYFKLPIKIMRGAIRHFNQSKQSKRMLKTLHFSNGIGRGLETIGKTRFATIVWAAIALRRNLPPISTLVTSGQVEIKLNQLISVTEGVVKAIQCLEAASCNPADVYLLWLAVTAHIRAALTTSMLPENVCNEIRGIINYRWNEFFVTNPGHEAYLATFYLNPKYVSSSIFKRPNVVAPFTITLPGKAPDAPIGVRNAKTFRAVGEYLFDQGALEVEHGIDPLLIGYEKKKRLFAEKFKGQFTAYAQGAFPFNTPLGEKEHPMTWWRALEGSEYGGIIAALALEFYSAVAHSMADERTVSVITWMNPALRNLEKVNTIFSFAQIRGWYRDTRTHARPHPEVEFYNIEREIHTVDDDQDNEDGDLDDEDSDDEFNTTLRADSEVLPSSPELDLESGEVDLDSALLGDILADAPGPRSSAAASEGLGDEPTRMIDDEDDDEEMVFELESWSTA
ncbi:ribonuclease H-like domain-containing protein, partial [Mycena rosella]